MYQLCITDIWRARQYEVLIMDHINYGLTGTHGRLGGLSITGFYQRVFYHKCSAHEVKEGGWSCWNLVFLDNIAACLFLWGWDLYPLLVLLDSKVQQVQLRLLSIEVESEVLLVQPLLAEVKELKLSREVLPHYIFGCLNRKVVKIQNSWWWCRFGW